MIELSEADYARIQKQKAYTALQNLPSNLEKMLADGQLQGSACKALIDHVKFIKQYL